MSDRPKRPYRPLAPSVELRTATALIGVQLVYVLIWTVMISRVLLGETDVRLLQVDMNSAVAAAHPTVITSVYVIAVGLAVSLYLAIRRYRWTIIPIAIAYLLHVAQWVHNTGNPHYKGEAGYGMIISEVIVIALLVSAMTRPTEFKD